MQYRPLGRAGWMQRAQTLYDQYIHAQVHSRW
jgi:hypothetical protein